MGELRRINFQAAIEDLRRRADSYQQAILRAQRAELWLQRIFDAQDIDEIYERIEEAEQAMQVEVRV